jgi:hypothetical protein
VKSIPAWKAEVRDTLVAKLQTMNYRVTGMGGDVWVIRPPEVDADIKVHGIGSLAAIYLAAGILNAQ